MTATKQTLQAKKRTVLGKKVRNLRAQHILPANIYGMGDSVAIEFDEKTFITAYKKAGETSVLYVQVEGEDAARPVLVHNLMLHPVKGNMLHADLRQVNLKVKVTANVPVVLEGESEAVKLGGVLITLHDELEVEALPTDLPEKFVLDISQLKAIGEELKVSNLTYDKEKIEIKLSADEPLVVVNEPKVEVEPEVTATPAEVELTEQGKAVEEGAEGAVAPAAKGATASAVAKEKAPEKK